MRTESGMTTLSDVDRAALEAAAAKVRYADTSPNQARREQEALWRELIAKGVTQVEIAEASGVTKGAVNQRVKR